MRAPTYHSREQAVLDAVHSFELRRRAGRGGTPKSILRPLNIWNGGISASDAWQEVADTLRTPAWRNLGVAVYAVATINGETCYAALSLEDGHNPWSQD